MVILTQYIQGILPRDIFSMVVLLSFLEYLSSFYFYHTYFSSFYFYHTFWDVRITYEEQWRLYLHNLSVCTCEENCCCKSCLHSCRRLGVATKDHWIWYAPFNFLAGIITVSLFFLNKIFLFNFVKSDIIFYRLKQPTSEIFFFLILQPPRFLYKVSYIFFQFIQYM